MRRFESDEETVFLKDKLSTIRTGRRRGTSNSASIENEFPQQKENMPIDRVYLTSKD